VNPSTHLARVIVDELARCGVKEAVLCPGSRSAPLALALYDADTAGRIRLHVRIDERSGGFLALGLAKVSGRPVAVLTTSGTAVANLHPAVLEAHHSGVPLVVLSADRPPHLRHSGANQTTDQVKIFGSAVRLFAELAPPAGDVGQVAAARTIVDRALAAATGVRSRMPGPAHLNVPFDEPLLPQASDAPLPWPPGRPQGRAWTRVPVPPAPPPAVIEPGPRTVVLAGDGAGPPARVLAERAGWPLLAEPSSGARTGSNALGPYRMLLDHPVLGGRVQRVVMYGRPTLSRPVSRLLARDDVEVIAVSPSGNWPDPAARVDCVLPAVTVERASDDTWLAEWRDADQLASAAIEVALNAEPWLTPYEVARVISQAIPADGLLVVGASHPIRDLDLMAVAHPVGERRKIIANRGLAGIDGTVSTAIGASLGRSSRSLAYLGDLTFLHDSTGLLIGPDEPRPDLTMVIANDDGGSVFSVLEQGDPRFAPSFERVFGTPTRADLAAICAGAGVGHTRVDDVEPLRQVLALPPAGLAVVEVRLDRTDRRDLEARIRDAVGKALAGQQARSSG